MQLLKKSDSNQFNFFQGEGTVVIIQTIFQLVNKS